MNVIDPCRSRAGSRWRWRRRRARMHSAWNDARRCGSPRRRSQRCVAIVETTHHAHNSKSTLVVNRECAAGGRAAAAAESARAGGANRLWQPQCRNCTDHQYSTSPFHSHVLPRLCMHQSFAQLTRRRPRTRARSRSIKTSTRRSNRWCVHSTLISDMRIGHCESDSCERC